MARIGIVKSSLVTAEKGFLPKDYLGHPEAARKKVKNAEIRLKAAKTALKNAQADLEKEENKELEGIRMLYE